MLPKKIFKQKIDEIKERDKLANKYDDFFEREYSQLLDYYCIDKHNEIKNREWVLDLACGTGRTSIKLASISNQDISIDFSYNSLFLLNDKINKNKINNIYLIQADANSLPFNCSNFFDFIN